MSPEELNLLSRKVLNAAYAVHTELGPGLLEKGYHACLFDELLTAGLAVRPEVPCPVLYKGRKIVNVGYVIDLLVENEIVLELKATDGIADVHRAQLLSYLKFSDRPLGFLLNFNVISMRDGIVRMVNRF